MASKYDIMAMFEYNSDESVRMAYALQQEFSGMECFIMDLDWILYRLPVGYSFGRSPRLCIYPETQCKRLCDGCGSCGGEKPF